jgi:hypothetical protein
MSMLPEVAVSVSRSPGKRLSGVALQANSSRTGDVGRAGGAFLKYAHPQKHAKARMPIAAHLRPRRRPDD